jgi:D-alanyl-D-alanine dipeptidase
LRDFAGAMETLTPEGVSYTLYCLIRILSGLPPFANSSVSVMILLVTRFLRLSLALPFLIFTSILPASHTLQAQTATTSVDSLLPAPQPHDAPPEWKQFLGIYGQGSGAVTIFEKDHKLFWRDAQNNHYQIYMGEAGQFRFSKQPGHMDDCFFISEGTDGRPPHLATCLDSRQPRPRTDAGADPSHFYHVSPVPDVPSLREKALALTPPAEQGPFQKPDLVEIAALDPAIHLDIRYAGSNNFLSTPVYTQAGAFMQRPAAEALIRALHKLQPLGYGLLIHDAYRPWYVTKIFWDATPPEGKIFVADPQQGSKHNRGCAVDLTLYDLATGQPIEMPGLYDEMSPRSFPNFPGGTSLQRWHRDLLRRAMESEGFTVNEDEWWHFDYKDWKQYGILNVPFEKLAIGANPSATSR